MLRHVGRLQQSRHQRLPLLRSKPCAWQEQSYSALPASPSHTDLDAHAHQARAVPGVLDGGVAGDARRPAAHQAAQLQARHHEGRGTSIRSALLCHEVEAGPADDAAEGGVGSKSR